LFTFNLNINMKKILIFVIAILAISCSSKSESESLYTTSEKSKGVEVVPRFNEGDVVYLKQDSLLVVITGINPFPTVPKYYYAYYTSGKDGIFRKTGTISEKLIY